MYGHFAIFTHIPHDYFPSTIIPVPVTKLERIGPTDLVDSTRINFIPESPLYAPEYVFTSSQPQE